MNKYREQQEFLDVIKTFALSNPDREITSDFVYSLLERYNINDGTAFEDVSHIFESIEEKYNSNKFVRPKRYGHFLFFLGKERPRGNELKIYLPLDKEHLEKGTNMVLDFITENEIIHQSKISRVVRADDFVIRVNTIEDANKIIDFATSNPYIQEGRLKQNPFVTDYNGVGLAMDNFDSYNSNVARLISLFVDFSKKHDGLTDFNVDVFNSFVSYYRDQEQDLDAKDLYSLIALNTDKDFKPEQFFFFAKAKLPDQYDPNTRERITNPKYYLNYAIEQTEKKHPGNSRQAIINYFIGSSTGFTRDNFARDGLEKYVPKNVLVELLEYDKNKGNFEDCVDQYLKKTNAEDIRYNLIKDAYVTTLRKYDVVQAKRALLLYFRIGDARGFTRDKNVRKNIESISPEEMKKIILKNIAVDGIDVNQPLDIIQRFEETLISEYEKKGENIK